MRAAPRLLAGRFVRCIHFAGDLSNVGHFLHGQQARQFDIVQHVGGNDYAEDRRRGAGIGHVEDHQHARALGGHAVHCDHFAAGGFDRLLGRLLAIGCGVAHETLERLRRVTRGGHRAAKYAVMHNAVANGTCSRPVLAERSYGCVMLELYHDWDAFCCIKVRFCLAEKGVPWIGRHIDLQRMEQLTPGYLALNPKGLVPTLLHNGRIVVESSVINEYVNECFDGPALSPVDPYERAQMRIWIKFEEDVLHPAVRGPTYQLMLRRAFAEMPATLIEERIAHSPTAEKAARLRDASQGLVPNLAEVDAARAVMNEALDVMEAHLQKSKWFG